MKRIWRSCWSKSPTALVVLWILPPCLRAQDSQVLAIEPPARIVAARGSQAEAKITVELKPGYHVNSHAPEEDYLIPLRLSWETKPFRVLEIVYPKPARERHAFAQKPLSVFSGAFQIITRLKVPSDAPRGPGILVGKLRYQACTDKLCFPPKTIEVRLPYEIR